MPRVKNDSLRYFPLDVNFFSDNRMRRMAGRFGADGPMFYLYILSRVYGGQGYYVVADDDFLEDAALDLHCSTEKIGLMLNYLLGRSLLDDKSFSTVKVLTSHGIQAQYQESMSGLRRDVEVDETLWILDDSETEGFIKVRRFENKSGKIADKSRGNGDKSHKNDTKEKKGKEIKSNESIGPESAPAPPARRKGVFQEFAGEDWELSQALREFSEMRVKIKRPLTDTAKERLCARLQRMFQNREDMIVALRESVDHCWQDVYDHRDKPAQPTRNAYGKMDIHPPAPKKLSEMERSAIQRMLAHSDDDEEGTA